jgi:NADH dehydrogenase FAD-containing subunit
MGKHLVLVGCGHAHLTTLLHLTDFVAVGHRVTVISPDTHHYYSGMGPGMLSGIYRPREVRFHVRRMAENRGAVFLKDRVERVLPEERVLRLSSGDEISYDVVSFNTGSEVPMELPVEAPQGIIPVKPVVNLYKARGIILDSPDAGDQGIVVVGGGPAGVEVAANGWRLLHGKSRNPRVTLIAGTRMLKGHPAKVREFASASLLGRGIRVLENVHVESFTRDSARLSDGVKIPCAIALVAVGVRSSQIFRESGLACDAQGGLLVNEHLQALRFPEIFGGGDCIGMPGRSLPKVGVYAVRQNPVLKHNLSALLAGNPLKRFQPGAGYLLIMNMGDGKGIAWKGGFAWNGRLAFRLKDIIDKRFMRRFQVSGEMDEPLEADLS